MITALHFPASDSFEHDFNQQVLLKIGMPLKLSWSAIQELKQSIKVLDEYELESLSTLRELEKSLDYFLF